MVKAVVKAVYHNQVEQVGGKDQVVTYNRGDTVEVSQEDFDRLAPEGLVEAGSDEADSIQGTPAVAPGSTAEIEAPVPSSPSEGSTDEDQGEDEAAYEDLTNAQLQARLRARGLAVSGNKDELIARLEEADEDEG